MKMLMEKLRTGGYFCFMVLTNSVYFPVTVFNVTCMKTIVYKG